MREYQFTRILLGKCKELGVDSSVMYDYLLRTYPVTEIALALAETLDIDIKPITITQEEFNLHFRIRGIKPDGTPENRGRRVKDTMPL